MTLHVVQKSQIKLNFRTLTFYQKFWQEGQTHSTLLELLGRLPKAQLTYLEDQLNTTTKHTVLSPEKLVTQSNPDKYTILTLAEFSPSLSQQRPPSTKCQVQVWICWRRVGCVYWSSLPAWLSLALLAQQLG